MFYGLQMIPHFMHKMLMFKRSWLLRASMIKLISMPCISFRRFIVFLTCLLFVQTQMASAQVSKGNQILIDRGLQIQGMVNTGDIFHLANYLNAHCCPSDRQHAIRQTCH